MARRIRETSELQARRAMISELLSAANKRRRQRKLSEARCASHKKGGSIYMSCRRSVIPDFISAIDGNVDLFLPCGYKSSSETVTEGITICSRLLHLPAKHGILRISQNSVRDYLSAGKK